MLKTDKKKKTILSAKLESSSPRSRIQRLGTFCKHLTGSGNMQVSWQSLCWDVGSVQQLKGKRSV